MRYQIGAFRLTHEGIYQPTARSIRSMGSRRRQRRRGGETAPRPGLAVDVEKRQFRFGVTNLTASERRVYLIGESPYPGCGYNDGMRK
jgi:hypothetical protein